MVNLAGVTSLAGANRMTTLYIDHSIVKHTPSWKSVEDVLTGGQARLALPLWNLLEIGLTFRDFFGSQV
jgi:hypothetical protein